MKKYETTVIDIGDMVEELLHQGMIVLFDNTAPRELQEMSVIHTGGTLIKNIITGDLLILGNSEYMVTAVGNVANRNLKKIGHVCLKFDAKTSPELPGDIHLQGDGLPLIIKGDTIVFEGNK